jgi:acetolactate synthase small subunit
MDNSADPSKPSSYAFLLKMSDQPGGMELIAATFAHRGVSLEASLGNDGALDPERRATVIVTFSAPPAKKENIRRALGRLSRVRSLTEYALDSSHLRKTAVIRVQGGIDDLGAVPAGMWLDQLPGDGESGEARFVLMDTPAAVDAFLSQVRETGRLRDATAAVIGL